MAIADTAGLPGYGGTLWEGGIGLAAGTQLIAATPGISLGCEFYMGLRCRYSRIHSRRGPRL